MLEKEIRIRDPHLAIEYFENYIKMFDYNSYIHDDVLLDENVESLINECMSFSYDNPLTYELEFRILIKLLSIRINSLALLEEEILDSYKKNNIIKINDQFEFYKKIISYLRDNADYYLSILIFDINMFIKYNGDRDTPIEFKEQYNSLKKALESVKNVSKLTDIKLIKKEELRKTRTIINRYVKDGLSPKRIYDNGVHYLNNEEYDKAIKELIRIPLYKDSIDIISRINTINYFDNDIIIFKENAYRLERIDNVSNLTNNGSVVIQNIKTIISKFGSTLFYINGSNLLISYNFESKELKEISNLKTKNIVDKRIILRDVYIILKDEKYSLFKLDMSSSELMLMKEDPSELKFINDFYILNSNTNTIIQKLEDNSFTKIIEKCIDILYIDDNYIIFNELDNSRRTFLHNNLKNRTQELDLNIERIVKIYKDEIYYEIKFGKRNILLSYSISRKTKRIISDSLNKFIGIYDDYIYVIEDKELTTLLSRYDVYELENTSLVVEVEDVHYITSNTIIYTDKYSCLYMFDLIDMVEKEITRLMTNIKKEENYIYFLIENALYRYDVLNKEYMFIKNDIVDYNVFDSFIYLKKESSYSKLNLNTLEEEIIFIASPQNKEDLNENESDIKDDAIRCKKRSFKELFKAKKNGEYLSDDELKVLRRHINVYYKSAILVTVILFIILLSIYVLFQTKVFR